MLDISPIEQRLASATGGTWTRHGANVHQENVAIPLFVGGTAPLRCAAKRTPMPSSSLTLTATSPRSWPR
jgi:hypothetical protein